MTLDELLNQPETDPHQWLRDAAAGVVKSDPLYDMAIEIVTELEREVTARGTAWHDISLHDLVAGIIRERLRSALKT